MKTVHATKLNMKQVYAEDGTVLPVTEVVVSEKCDLLVGDILSVTGTAKGKGFAGVIKRWGFAGGPHTHGQKDKQRSGGSIGGGTYPGKVWKGKKMPGRMGGQRVTVKNLEVVNIEGEKISIKGAVPGHRNSEIILKKISSADTKVENES